MSASDVLREFNRIRKLLNNLGEQHATERLAAMSKFLDSRDETRQIRERSREEHGSMTAQFKTGQPVKAGSEGEIIEVGLCIMEACHDSNEHVTSIATRAGIVSKHKGATRQSYVDDAMNGYVYHALDLVEYELGRMADEEKATGFKSVIETNQDLFSNLTTGGDEGNEGVREDGGDGRFVKVKNMMPRLFEEMRNDFSSKEGRLIREFIVLPNKRISFNTSKKKVSLLL